MKKIHIFKPGTHTDSAGTTLEFTEQTLQTAAESYDKSVHEAPLVIGHPKSNGPAYGWVSGIEFTNEGIFAEPSQLNSDFEEMVKEGAFKKVSASWYLPESPSNPKPGVLYLRHIGFLGAQAPAIKGLQPIDFNESDDGLVEFSADLDQAYTNSAIASVFRGMREFIIDKFSKKDADEVLPSYLIEDIQASATNQINNPLSYEENTMTLEELQAKHDELQTSFNELQDKHDNLETENATLKSDNDALSAKVTSFEEQQKLDAKNALESEIDALIAAGHATPADKQMLVAFAEGITGTVSFGEDGSTIDAKTALFDFIKNRTAVDFNEHSADDSSNRQEMTSAELSRKAVAYQEEQASKGNHITIATAVKHISTQE